MGDGDPHIHVEQNLNAMAMTRDVVASAFGLVGDLPSVVTTGCGVTVQRAMTSPHPERVTCLPCRKHARREYLRYADQMETLCRMPGMNITETQAREAADWCRDLAERFSSG